MHCPGAAKPPLVLVARLPVSFFGTGNVGGAIRLPGRLTP
jgi:hypothetical protein